MKRVAANALVLFLLVLFEASNGLAAEFDACVRALRGEAMAKGITRQTFDRAMTASSPIRACSMRWTTSRVHDTDLDYLAGLVDDQRIADGRAKLASGPRCCRTSSGSSAWTRISSSPCGARDRLRQKYGQALADALAGDGSVLWQPAAFLSRRADRGLRILQSGDLPPEALTGSWAGAFGHTQFCLPRSASAVRFRRRRPPRSRRLGTRCARLHGELSQARGWVSGSPGLRGSAAAGFSGPSGRRPRKC